VFQIKEAESFDNLSQDELLQQIIEEIGEVCCISVSISIMK